jgi:hypothetical protein
MSIIENKFRTYLAALDGAPKDFSTVAHLFDELYDDEFTLQDKGSIATREQMKRTHAKAFELGSKATLLHCSTSSDNSIEYKFRLVNDQWDLIIHCIATVKDGKIYKAQSVKGSKALLLRNIRAYIAESDGTPKPISNLFDEIYDEEFVLQVNSNLIGRDMMKQIHTHIFSLGSKATLLLFKEVDNDNVEFKLRLTNDKVDVVIHNIAKVKNNKLISAKPVNQAAMDSVSKIREACQTSEADASSEVTITKSLSSVQAESDYTISVPQ